MTGLKPYEAIEILGQLSTDPRLTENEGIACSWGIHGIHRAMDFGARISAAESILSHLWDHFTADTTEEGQNMVRDIENLQRVLRGEECLTP